MPGIRTDQLNSVLKDLSNSTPDIEASGLISTDGLIIATNMPQDIDQDRVAAMSAAMLSISERTSKELSRSNLEQVFIKGENGYVVLINAGKDVVLLAIVKKEPNLGLIFLNMKRAISDLSKLVQ